LKFISEVSMEMCKELLRMNKTVFTICITFLLQINPTAAEPYKPWAQLTPVQQEALQPLSARWSSLPAKLQENLLRAANRYPKLPPEKKRRFQSRLEKWSQLTPEQRKRAREKYKAFSRVPQAKRAQVQQMVREQEAGNTATLGVPAPLPRLETRSDILINR
jgi:hypothetical protein